MNLFELKGRQRIWLHVLYWTLFVLFFSILDGIRYGEFMRSLTRELSILPARIMGIYFILYFLLPRFIPEKKYASFILYTVITMIVAGILQRVFFHLIYYPFFVPRNIASPLWDFFRILDEVMSINTALIVPLTYKLMQYWRRNQVQAEKLAREKVQAELTALKNQINPHFLFNTLNNIYGLALKNSQNLPAIILKLSDILSYILYESNTEQVPLQKEVTLLENYIELQKIRYEKDLRVDFHADLPATPFYLAPMLLLPFLENAFKHGASKQTGPKYLGISIKVKDENLFFRIENSLPEHNQEQQNLKNGIGIKNVLSRLDIIYPGMYKFRQYRSKSFIIELELKTNI